MCALKSSISTQVIFQSLLALGVEGPSRFDGMVVVEVEFAEAKYPVYCMHEESLGLPQISSLLHMISGLRNDKCPREKRIFAVRSFKQSLQLLLDLFFGITGEILASALKGYSEPPLDLGEKWQRVVELCKSKFPLKTGEGWGEDDMSLFTALVSRLNFVIGGLTVLANPGSSFELAESHAFSGEGWGTLCWAEGFFSGVSSIRCPPPVPVPHAIGGKV